MNTHPVSFSLDRGLSHEETLLIGAIIVEWAAIEHEIFSQVVRCLEDAGTTKPALPTALKGKRFSDVLDIWKEKVAEVAPAESSEILKSQCNEIHRLVDFRNALAHGMWEWNSSDVRTITSYRIKKDSLIVVHFTADTLRDFCSEVKQINFLIRYPGGQDEFFRVGIEKGGTMLSRSLFLPP